MFKQLTELQREAILASDAGPSNARGGEGRSEREKRVSWKPILEFILQDESDDDGILEVESLEPLNLCDDEEEEDLAENIVLGLQALREQHVKVLLDE